MRYPSQHALAGCGEALSTYFVTEMSCTLDLAGAAAAARVRRTRLAHAPAPRQHIDLVLVLASPSTRP